ncbi:MAG: hypothetical protein IPL35_12755 [Sphingobacteriales bacterium]|nr:hypothetical protein [Sphingobacteriales bacterium]
MGGKEKIPKAWFIRDTEALNYKVRVEAENAEEQFFICSGTTKKIERNKEILKNKLGKQVEYLQETQYFADNQFLTKEKITETKLGVMHSSISVHIFSFHLDLLEVLKKDNQLLLKKFFASENFGTRQSKGFGCFQAAEIKEQELIELWKTIPQIKGIFFRKFGNKDLKDNLLQTIAKDYSLLKRGYNGEESKLYEYMLCKPKKIIWEKTIIQKYLKLATQNPKKTDACPEPNENYKYVRALLGLAEHFEFKELKLIVKIKDTSDDKIDRFRSPLRYVIFGSSIFLLVYDIPAILHTKKDGTARKFKFSFEGREGAFCLEIPRDFNLVDFIEKKANYGKNLKQNKSQ